VGAMLLMLRNSQSQEGKEKQENQSSPGSNEERFVVDT